MLYEYKNIQVAKCGLVQRISFKLISFNSRMNKCKSNSVKLLTKITKILIVYKIGKKNMLLHPAMRVVVLLLICICNKKKYEGKNVHTKHWTSTEERIQWTAIESEKRGSVKIKSKEKKNEKNGKNTIQMERTERIELPQNISVRAPFVYLYVCLL